LLGDISSIEGLGRNFGSDLYEVEVRYLVAEEWARTAADILWRRSKKGLYLSAQEVLALDEYLAGQTAGVRA
jgi:glycerol-3-phosphate dehydrogenase